MIDATLEIKDLTYRIRSARREDVSTIAELLADDVLGSERERADDDLAPYYAAFDRFEAHPNQELIVVERDGEVVGTLDFSILSSLSRTGALRGQIEAVRIASSERGTGIGHAIFQWAISHARTEGCTIIQLTTDRSREAAQRFYERLGFKPSHVGYKIDLTQPGLPE